MADAASQLPPVKIVARGPNGVVLYSGSPKPAATTGSLSNVPGERTATSRDGKQLAVVSGGDVRLFNTESETEVCKLSPGKSDVVASFFSPKGTYLTTLERPIKEEGNAHKNLKVWRVSSGEPVLQLYQKNVTKDLWPFVHWNSDESMAYHMVTNAVNGYSAEAFDGGVAKKLYLKNVAAFSISPGSGSVMVSYVPEIKSSPASVAVFNVGDLPSGGTDAPQPLARRNFFRCSSVSMAWSPAAHGVVVTSINDVDATNQSYYGEQKLHFMSADGSIEQAVPLQKEGPIHDVQWTPRGDYFVVVHGYTPAKVLLFDYKCKPVFDMGSGPYGMAAWNPQGRFLALGGFGNLSGDLMFLDKKADGKCKPIANVKAACTVLTEWSPCGRYFLTATTSPRLRVDNGYKIWKYDGTLMHEEKMDVLLDISFLPALPGVFPDRPQSPRAAGSPTPAKPASLAPVPQAKGYVPPHLRGRQGAAPSSSGNFSLAYDANDNKMGRPTSSRQNLTPGAVPGDGKAASKNAKRRANRKKAAAEAQDTGNSGQESANSVPIAEMAGMAVESTDVAAPAAAAPDPEKKIKNLKKKLSQIQQLKDKRSKEGEGVLDPDQIKKIATEDQVKAEIIALGGTP